MTCDIWSRNLIVKISGSNCAICENPCTNPFVMKDVQLRMCSTCISIFGSNPPYNLKLKKKTT